MSRKLLINIHLYLAAFFTPVLLIMAISGGLYLMGIKGSYTEQQVFQGNSVKVDPSNKHLEDEVSKILASLNIDHSFDYAKKSGSTLYTRPTSKLHYVIQSSEDEVTVIERTPDFVKRLVELHKGHGPSWFKTFQKVMAAGLIFILITGLWLGLASPMLKRQTWAISISGVLIFVLLASL